MSYKGTTPTFILTFPEDVDLTQADDIYVSFATADKTLFTKKTEDVIVSEANTIRVSLTQQETLKFPQKVFIQVNWTYTEGGRQKRACGEIKTHEFKRNLYEGEME